MAACSEILSEELSSEQDMDLSFSRGSRAVTICAEVNECLPKGFIDFWENKKLYDLHLSCRGKVLRAHRILLSGMSTYFESAIVSLSNKGYSSVYNLEFDCEACLMELCLQYLYTGKADVDLEFLSGLANLAKLLDIRHLYVSCKRAELRSTGVNVDNCLEGWCFSQTYGDIEMVGKCQELALAKFEDLIGSKNFMSLCPLCLSNLVTHEKLAVSSPTDRLGAAVVWLGYDKDARSNQFLDIMQKLPMKEVSQSFLRQVLHNPVIQGSCLVRDAISEILEKQRVHLKPPAIVPRQSVVKSSSKVKSLISIGCLKPDKNPLTQKVYVTPLKFTSKWRTLTSLPLALSQKGQSVGSCSVDSQLFVTGLGKKRNQGWCYDLESLRWVKYGDLMSPREHHCMAVCDGNVFVLGGCKPRTSDLVREVEVFDSSSKKWCVAGTLNGDLCSNACCCVVDDAIFVHGALDADKNRIIQSYSPQTKLSECLARFVSEQNFTVRGIVSAQNQLILFGSKKAYVCPKQNATGQVRKRSKYTLPHAGQMVCVDAGGTYLYAFGGFKNNKDDEIVSHVHRARVQNVLDNTGTGWKPVDMGWPDREMTMFPGSHCTAMVKVDVLEEI